MAEFFAELKRRHLYRVAGAYIVVAWVLLQLFNNLEPILKLPEWAGTLVLVFLAGGFPIALIFAWTLELKAAQASADGPSLRMKSVEATTQRHALVASAHPGSVGRTGVISIAVLPFANMSGDAGQEFFSDGMSEEITAALAKIPSLRVVARTSAFAFKGQNEDMRAVGHALGANHLIEGSVRKAGDRVRITAQLIKVEDGTHLWAENYDRQLADIFATQEDIAQAIAGALRVPLGLKQSESLVSNRMNDTAAYQDYLRAKALVRARGLKQLTDAAALLEQVVARDPEFAPAWALLSLAYLLTATYHPAWMSGQIAEARRVVDATMPKAEVAAKRAIRLDARQASGYMALAYAHATRGRYLSAEECLVKALELDGYDPDVLNVYSQMLAAVGRLKEALAMRKQLLTLEPFVPIFNSLTAIFLWLNGQADEALALLKDVPPHFTWSGPLAALIYASLGHYREAADAVQAIPSGIFLPGATEDAARLLRTAPTAAASPQTLPRLGFLAFVYLHIGAPSRAFEFYDDMAEDGYLQVATVAHLWHPSRAPLRKTEHFKAFARKAGLVEYWRAKGWPDFCRPTIGDDFDCN